MKRTSTWMAAPVLAAVSLQPALAADPVVNPWALRAGPSAATDDTNSTFGFQVGASRQLGPGRVDIDFSRESGNGVRARTVGASYVHRFEFGPKFYAGLGVGVYHVSVSRGGSGTAVDNDKFSLGGKVLLGYNITNRLFVEAGYTKVQSVSGIDASNASIVLGIRF